MEANTAAPAIVVKGYSWELLEELLNAADQGGDPAGGACGRRRREFRQCLKRAHAESTRE